jgi:hypothetical protein
MSAELSDEVLRAALDVVLTWGPERATPEEDRLSAAHAGLGSEQVAAALSEAHAVLRAAESLAPAIKGTGAAPTTRSGIVAAHPWLTDDLLERSVQQGLYFHWRDTGE